VLAEQLGVTMGAVSQQLARLEEKGFIKRVQMPQDKRQYSVKLTDKGRKLYDLHKQYDQENYARVLPMFKEFSEQDLEVIMKFEEKFREFIDLANKEVGTDDNY
jgi:DNA-binding MarR family transcriptional regulator